MRALACILRNVGTIAVFLVLTSADAKTDALETIVYKVYHDYAWEAVAAPESWGLLGNPLASESSTVLRRYFYPELVALFIKEQVCLKQHPGELCNLEFDPLFASQDSSASDLHIKTGPDGAVYVTFKYPSTNQSTRIKFICGMTANGPRIKDIVYISSGISLMQILAK